MTESLNSWLNSIDGNYTEIKDTSYNIPYIRLTRDKFAYHCDNPNKIIVYPTSYSESVYNRLVRIGIDFSDLEIFIIKCKEYKESVKVLYVALADYYGKKTLERTYNISSYNDLFKVMFIE